MCSDKSKDQVSIDFGIGTLTCERGRLEFVFFQSQDDAKRAEAPPDPSLLKQAARWKKPKPSQEVEALRNKYPLVSCCV